MNDSHVGRNLLVLLKATAGMPSPALIIPVGYPPKAFLRPVATKKELLNAEDICLLTCWRNRFVQAFLSEFQATESRTAQWLVDVVGPKEGKILFMLDNPNGGTVGYMGLGYIEWERRYGEAGALGAGAGGSQGTIICALPN